MNNTLIRGHSEMNLQNKTSQKGFTIVELLIVIVVIGILAAISIVAYNGIQNRAKASQRQADATNIAKVAEAINAGEGSSGYPTDVAAFSATTADVKMPTGVTLDTALATAAADPSTETAAGPTGKQYKWKTCGNTGLEVYYWNPADKAVKTVTAGTGC